MSGTYCCQMRRRREESSEILHACQAQHAYPLADRPVTVEVVAVPEEE